LPSGEGSRTVPGSSPKIRFSPPPEVLRPVNCPHERRTLRLRGRLAARRLPWIGAEERPSECPRWCSYIGDGSVTIKTGGACSGVLARNVSARFSDMVRAGSPRGRPHCKDTSDSPLAMSPAPMVSPRCRDSSFIWSSSRAQAMLPQILAFR